MLTPPALPTRVGSAQLARPLVIVTAALGAASAAALLVWGSETAEAAAAAATVAVVAGVFGVKLTRQAVRLHRTGSDCRGGGLLALGTVALAATAHDVGGDARARRRRRKHVAQATALGLVRDRRGPRARRSSSCPGAATSLVARLRRFARWVSVGVCLLFISWMLVVAPPGRLDSLGFWRRRAHQLHALARRRDRAAGRPDATGRPVLRGRVAATVVGLTGLALALVERPPPRLAVGLLRAPLVVAPVLMWCGSGRASTVEEPRPTRPAPAPSPAIRCWPCRSRRRSRSSSTGPCIGSEFDQPTAAAWHPRVRGDRAPGDARRVRRVPVCPPGGRAGGTVPEPRGRLHRCDHGAGRRPDRALAVAGRGAPARPVRPGGGGPALPVDGAPRGRGRRRRTASPTCAPDSAPADGDGRPALVEARLRDGFGALARDRVVDHRPARRARGGRSGRAHPRRRASERRWSARCTGSPTPTSSPGWPTAASSCSRWSHCVRSPGGRGALIRLELEGFTGVNDVRGYDVGRRRARRGGPAAARRRSARPICRPACPVTSSPS